MKSSTSLAIAGIGLGAFAGSSMGIVAFGGGMNAAWVFGPVGGIIGWLVSDRLGGQPNPEHQPKVELSPKDCELEKERQENTPAFAKLIASTLMLLAYLWNIHITTLEKLGLLDSFVRQPLLFLGLCILVSLVFPPFLGVYFFCWVAAVEFGAKEETRYTAQLK
ncbi:hypothetical protein [Roseovarius sp. SYSU LYC5161]|jgi:hypothetical protein|uniref:hypothetical protein n=1 Tax=Roseovarius halophilus (ex Wu et al. 2025) TaxID=3376060 RepID=UPI00399A531D